jgi:SAM-dependent methyltransferase
MGLVGGTAGVRILKALSPTGQSSAMSDGVPPAYQNKSKLEQLFGDRIWDELRDKVVVDFGCGEGHEVAELAEHGVRHVIGLDTELGWREVAAQRVAARGVADRCTIAERWTGTGLNADVIISLDSFEHFEEPAAILETMHRMLKPEGRVLVAFGPPWYHPYGGHLFSVFPWAHLVFSEYAMVTWRTGLPGKEPASSLRDAGINQMTVRRFERLVAASPFQFTTFEAVPIRRRRWPRWSREFTTSIVRCRLEARPRAAAGAAPPFRSEDKTR